MSDNAIPEIIRAAGERAVAETALTPSVPVPMVADRADHHSTLLGESKDGEAAVTVGGESALVPNLIVAAGEQAASAYRSYLASPSRAASTRKL
jgi:hypothetical protein